MPSCPASAAFSQCKPPRSLRLPGDSESPPGGMALCAAAWDATALLGNPLAVPGVTGSLACMAAVGAATAARGQLERLGGYLSGLLAGSWGRGDA